MKIIKLQPTAVEKARDDAELEANVEKIRAQINAEVNEIKSSLAGWLNHQWPEPYHSSPTTIALLETAFERALDTHEADAGEYIQMVFEHVAQKRKGSLT